MDAREEKIIEYIQKTGDCSSKEVYDHAGISVSYATLKRLLTKLLSENYLSSKGKGKGTKYIISPIYEVIQPIDIDQYYEQEIDDRKIKEGFNFSIIKDVFGRHSVFTQSEFAKLKELQQRFRTNIS